MKNKRGVWCLNFFSRAALAAGILSLYVTSSFAAPYGPEGKAADYRQPDGTIVKVRVFGDEFYAVAETTEGYTVVFDNDKVLTYGNVSADGKNMVSTGIRADNKPDHAALQAAGIKKNTRLNPEGRAEAVARGLQRLRADSKGRIKHQTAQYYSAAASSSGAQPASSSETDVPIPPPSYAPPTETRLGKYVGLCLLVDFSDQVATVAQSAVDDFCNKPGYTNFNNSGSIYDYFYVQSGGRLRYNNIVTAYVRVPNPKTYYDDGSSLPWGSSKAQQLIIDALNVLMAQGFDFTPISRDGSGYIYSLNVFYAGTCASPWSTGLWPGSWAIPVKTVDAANGIKAYAYQMTDIGSTLDIGTFCHENGHMLLDYPDLYSYDGNAANISNFSLMAGGNHADGGRHPTNVDPYLKAASGWATIVDLTSNSQQRCTLQVDNNLFYRYRNPAKTTEYFIFEVRDNTGYEGPFGGAGTSVNPTAGLVVYHAYESGSNPRSSIFTSRNPTNSYAKPYELLLVEANQPAINPWYDDPSPDVNDAFKSTVKNYLSDTTTPNLKFWVATSTGGGRLTNSGCIITNVSTDGASMSFVVGGGVLSGTPAIVLSRSTIDSFCDLGDTAASQSFTICNGQGGALNYTVSADQSWISCTPTNGTATNESDTIAVNFSTSNLVAGSYSATITVSDPLAVPASATITVNLTVHAQPVLNLSLTNIVKNGVAKMPGTQASFAIRNTGGGAMTYSLSKTQSWVSLSSTSGTVVAETDIIYVNLNSLPLEAGTYYDTITVTCPEASNAPLTIPVTFTLSHVNMQVASLNGGNVLYSNGSTNITWISSLGGNVFIELLKGGVFDSQIVASTTNDASYAWTVPVGKSGTNYSIRITSLSPSPVYSDESDGFFSIVQPVMNLSITNIVENGIAGSAGPQVELMISKTPGGSMAYSLSKTKSWLTLSPTSGTVAAETDSITVSFDATLLASGSYADTITITSPEASNSPRTIPVSFSVNGDDIVVTSPNGGEAFDGSTAQTVTWASSLGGTVKIDLLKGGAVFRTIVASTANDGSYDWAFPAGIGGENFRILITSIEQGTKTDSSNADFTIYPSGGTCDSFETGLDGWVQETNGTQDDFNWTRLTGATPSASTGPTAASDGSYYLYTEASGYLNKTANIYKDFDFSTVYEPMLVFDYHMYGSTMGTLYLEVSTNNGTSWDAPVAWSLSGDQGDAWHRILVDLSAYGSLASVRLRFRGVTGSNYYSDMAIDRVCVVDVISSGLMFNSSLFSVQENVGNATITVNRSGSTTGAVSVNYATANGTAISGADYTATNGVLSWADGEGGAKTFTVSIIDESAHEVVPESIILMLSNPTGTTIIGSNPTTLSITDNDNSAPVVYAGPDQTVLLTGGAWSPASLSPMAWYDASDTNTLIQSGGVVSQWSDRSGQSNHLSQSTVAYRPVTTNGQINGLTAISFDGGNDVLRTATNPFGATISNAFVMAVLNVGVLGSSTAFSLSASGANRWQSHAPWGDGTVYFDCGGSGGANRLQYASGWAASQVALMGYYCSVSDNVQEIWEGGTKKASDVTGHAVATSGTLAFGSDGGTSYDNVKFGEVLIINSTIASTNRQCLEGYLANKWGLTGTLPANHPYKAQGPSTAFASTNIDGTVTEPDNDPVSTLWTVVSGPGPVVFTDDAAIDTIVSFTVEGVYTLRLTASDGVLQASDDVLINVTTNLSQSTMSAPTGLSASALATNQIKLAWTDNSTNETGFAVQRSLTSGSGFSSIGTPGVNATNYTDNTVSAATTYYYRVAATNDTTNSVYSGEASATTPKLPATVTLGSLSQTYNGTARAATYTTSPTGLTVTVTYNGVAIAPTNAGSYAVTGTVVNATYQGQTNGTLAVAKATPTVTTWPTAISIAVGQALSNATLTGGSASVPGSFSYNSPTNIPPVGIYTAAVTFVVNDSTNYVNVAGTVSVTVQALAIPAPTGLSATALATNQIKLAWTDSSTNETGFTVQRSLTSGSGFAAIGSAAANATNYTDMTVSYATTYYYRVAATNATTNSLFSAEASATTPKLPAAVTLGSLSQTYNGTARAATYTTSPTGLTVTVTYNGVAVAPTNAGSYAVTGTVVSATYTGSTNGLLQVVAKSVSTLTIASAGPLTYTGLAQTPEPQVNDGATVLVKNTHFTYAYSANTNAGTATVTVTGSGNYTGTTNNTFSITRATLTVTPNAGQSKVFSGIDPTLVYTNSGAVAGETAGFAGALTRAAGESVGSYAITQGTLALANNAAFKTNNYTLAFTGGVNFTITGKSVSTLTIGNVGPFTYDGNPKTPQPVVSDGAVILTNTVSYTLSYTNNTNVGSGTVIVTGIGNYSGTTNKTFTITSATPTGIVWPTAAPIILGQALSNATLTGGSASVPGSFTYVSPTNIPLAGVTNAAVRFTPTDSVNYVSVIGTVPVTVVDNYAVPFWEPFEARTNGNLNTQYGWVADGTVVQTNKAFAGTKAAQVSGGGGYLKHAFTDGRTKVWTDLRVQVVHSPEKPTPEVDATASVYVFTNAMVMAFNGTNAVPTGITAAQGEWVRFTMFSDYATKKYVIYVNDVRAGKYGFYNVAVTNFTEIKVSGEATFVDNVGVTPNQPGMKYMPSLILLQ
jgi:M6 family metalloprotease-like protein